MGNDRKAFEYYEKALKLKEKALDENHPDLADSYHIIGVVYNSMGNYTKALEYYEKAFSIRKNYH